MKLLLTVIVSGVFASTSSAYMFPFFPGYSAGYCGYAPPAYAYSGYGYARSYGYAPVYSASYGGFSSSCCETSCCDSPCGNNCGTLGCGSGNCISSGVRKEPVPDTGLDSQKTDDLDRTFGSDRPERPPYDDRLRREPPADDGFSRPNDSLKSNADRWEPGSRRSSDPLDPLDPLDQRDPLDSFGPDPNRAPFGSELRNKPSIDDPAPEGPPDPNLPIDRSTNKPPMTLPIEDEAPSSDAESVPGTETSPQDFLPPEANDDQASRRRSLISQSDVRSSHFDVLSMSRLAGKSRPEMTHLSSVRSKQRPPQWISVPLPEGRIRL